MPAIEKDAKELPPLPTPIELPVIPPMAYQREFGRPSVVGMFTADFLDATSSEDSASERSIAEDDSSSEEEIVEEEEQAEEPRLSTAKDATADDDGTSTIRSLHKSQSNPRLSSVVSP